MINRLFAQHLPPHYTLIDREEDLGLEGLRQSKLSYHPPFPATETHGAAAHRGAVAAPRVVARLLPRRHAGRCRTVSAEPLRRTAMPRRTTRRADRGDAPHRAVPRYGLHLRRGDGARLPAAGTGRRTAARSARPAAAPKDSATPRSSPGSEELRRWYAGFGFAGTTPRASVRTTTSTSARATLRTTAPWYCRSPANPSPARRST